MGRFRKLWTAVQQGLSIKDLLVLVGAWKVLVSFLVGGGLFLLGLIRQIDIVYLIPATLVAVSAFLWTWNQFSLRREIRGVRLSVSAGGTPSDLPRATVEELRQTYIADRRLRIVDIPRNGPVIEGKVFDNCVLEGPAVVVGHELTIDDSGHDSPPGATPEEAFAAIAWVRPQSGWITGAIRMDRCIVRNSWFIGVGFVVSPVHLDDFRRGFGLSPLESD